MGAAWAHALFVRLEDGNIPPRLAVGRRNSFSFELSLHLHTAISKGNGAAYHYYVCKRWQERRQECDCTQRSVRAVEVERAVWELVLDSW